MDEEHPDYLNEDDFEPQAAVEPLRQEPIVERDSHPDLDIWQGAQMKRFAQHLESDDDLINFVRNNPVFWLTLRSWLENGGEALVESGQARLKEQVTAQERNTSKAEERSATIRKFEEVRSQNPGWKKKVACPL